MEMELAVEQYWKGCWWNWLSLVCYLCRWFGHPSCSSSLCSVFSCSLHPLSELYLKDQFLYKNCINVIFNLLAICAHGVELILTLYFCSFLFMPLLLFFLSPSLFSLQPFLFWSASPHTDSLSFYKDEHQRDEKEKKIDTYMEWMEYCNTFTGPVFILCIL